MAQKDIFDESFKSGEEDAMETMKHTLAAFLKEFKGKDAAKTRLRSFAGYSAGYLSCFLFQSYMEMIRLLRQAQEDETLAEFWCQKVVATFGEAVTQEKLPVQLNFMIKRDKK